MNSSSLEITENEYCIKLDKGTFDLKLIQQLVNRIQSKQGLNKRMQAHEEDDIISRRKDHMDEGNYDRLSDK